ncbi:MAG TPA: class I SAM-dependent methyltransferase [Acidimicrobiales bacterium]|nr:class I SAM-dependent methyltransferase [Acidimicrobiales bacterium]
MTHEAGPTHVTSDGGDDPAQGWVREQARHDRMLAAYGRLLLAAADLRPGRVVVDVGCGTGETTVAAALAVAPGGRVVGIDASEVMLVAARRRAEASAAGNVHFVHADAEDHKMRRARADVILSRFGTLHFLDPAGAFANLREALVPGGRLCFTAWAEEAANAWSTIPRRVLAGHVPHASPHGHADGPFGFADPDRIRQVLADAGYVDVRVSRSDEAVWVGADRADAVSFFLATASKALRDADEATAAAVGRELGAALDPFVGPDGVVLPAAAWIVTASGA